MELWGRFFKCFGNRCPFGAKDDASRILAAIGRLAFLMVSGKRIRKVFLREKFGGWKKCCIFALLRKEQVFFLYLHGIG